ncbi:MAG TPA: GGDEF domain-containing protein [Spirochaetia bacterium]|nr:GGDEF domain-containing protein [Spirochaetia bacterium]
MEKLELLSSVDLFSQLSTADLRLLADHASFYDFAPGDVVYAAGTADRELFVIDNGDVRIARTGDEGREIDLARFVSGESFGEQDFLSDSPRTASAICERDSRVLVFPTRGTSLDALMMQYPTLFARVLHQFLVIVAGRIRSTNKLVSENSSWVQELRKQVFGDKLTGLYSKSFLDDEVDALLSRSRGGAGIFMIKPDNFKLINDSFGHEVGDQVLRILANHLKSLLDEQDIAVRYRNNEFVAVILSSGPEDVIAKAESIRVGMTGADLSPVIGDERVPLTFSVGVALYPEHGRKSVTLSACALELVYAARDAGGDRVITADRAGVL